MEADIKQLKKVRQQEQEARQTLLQLAQKRRDLMRRLHSQGMTFKAIGLVYGVRKQRVEWICKERTEETK